MSKKEFMKNQIQTLVEFVNEKGNAMTFGDMANISESINDIRLKLEDSEEDFPNKDVVIANLNDLKNTIRETPYFNLISIVLGSLIRIIYFLK